MEAAKAYDREAVLRRGIHAVTNFDLAEYMELLGSNLVFVVLHACSTSACKGTRAQACCYERLSYLSCTLWIAISLPICCGLTTAAACFITLAEIESSGYRGINVKLVHC